MALVVGGEVHVSVDIKMAQLTPALVGKGCASTACAAWGELRYICLV